MLVNVNVAQRTVTIDGDSLRITKLPPVLSGVVEIGWDTSLQQGTMCVRNDSHGVNESEHVRIDDPSVIQPFLNARRLEEMRIEKEQLKARRSGAT